MTSDSTNLETKKHIDKVAEETGFPIEDILIFSQNEIPTLDFNGKLLLKTKGIIATNPGYLIFIKLINYFFRWKRRCI